MSGRGFQYLAAIVLAVISIAARAGDQSVNLMFETSRFLTPWQNYASQTFDLGIGAKRKQDNFAVAGDLRLSNTLSNYVLGNINELYGQTGLLKIGRIAPSRSVVERHGLQEALNQSVCYTPFDCSYGGPVGLHLQTDVWRLSLHLLNVPDISASPSIDDQGRLTSSNRWGRTPIQSVEINGSDVALKNELILSQGLKPLLWPGLSGDWHLSQRKRFDVKLLGQLAIHNPHADTDQKLGFETQSGDTVSVVKNKVVASFPYETVLSVQQKSDFEKFYLLSELTYWDSPQDPSAQSATVGIGSRSVPLSPLMLVGVEHSTEAGRPFLQFKISQTMGAFESLVAGEINFLPKKKAFYLSPELIWHYQKKSQIFLTFQLIQADELNPFYGPIRGNDNVLVGFRHEL